MFLDGPKFVRQFLCLRHGIIANLGSNISNNLAYSKRISKSSLNVYQNNVCIENDHNFEDIENMIKLIHLPVLFSPKPASSSLRSIEIIRQLQNFQHEL